MDSLEDRRLLAVDLGGYWLTAAPGSKTTTWGSTIALDQVQVQNLGSTVSGGFNQRFYLSRDTTYSPDDVLLNLASGGNTLSQGGIAGYSYGPKTSTSLVLPGALPSGWTGSKFYIVMYTDALNQVAESNESNNSGQRGQTWDYDTISIANVDVTLKVAENASLVDTGITLAAGDRVVFSASGTIWAGVWFTGRNGPGGWNNIANDPHYPDPKAHAYSLLGCIAGYQYFEIGTGFDKVYTGSNNPCGSDQLSDHDRLYLRINDDKPGNGDGAFYVHIQVYRAYQTVQPDGKIFPGVSVYLDPNYDPICITCIT